MRIIEIKEIAARVRLRLGCLVFDGGDVNEVSIPASEIGILILSNPAITCSVAAISQVAENGGVVLTCDSRWLPNGILLPINGNHIQTQRLRLQTEAKAPLKKRLWQAIVQRKIFNQCDVLKRLFNDDFGLSNVIQQVKSGDSTNVEARAAKKYWGAIFGHQDFRRSDSQAPQNPLLNYGYSVLRAIIARAICASGLHPSLGIHHKNKYNAFCLADDLMEPFRPCVDLMIARMLQECPCLSIEDTSIRGRIISAVASKWKLGNESRSIFDASSRLATSLVESFQSNKPLLDLPLLGG
jgi:CRISPR-associated protein Cas1